MFIHLYVSTVLFNWFSEGYGVERSNGYYPSTGTGTVSLGPGITVTSLFNGNPVSDPDDYDDNYGETRGTGFGFDDNLGKLLDKIRDGFQFRYPPVKVHVARASAGGNPVNLFGYHPEQLFGLPIPFLSHEVGTPQQPSNYPQTGTIPITTNPSEKNWDENNHRRPESSNIKNPVSSKPNSDRRQFPTDTKFPDYEREQSEPPFGSRSQPYQPNTNKPYQNQQTCSQQFGCTPHEIPHQENFETKLLPDEDRNPVESNEFRPNNPRNAQVNQPKDYGPLRKSNHEHSQNVDSQRQSNYKSHPQQSERHIHIYQAKTENTDANGPHTLDDHTRPQDVPQKQQQLHKQKAEQPQEERDYADQYEEPHRTYNQASPQREEPMPQRPNKHANQVPQNQPGYPTDYEGNQPGPYEPTPQEILRNSQNNPLSSRGPYDSNNQHYPGQPSQFETDQPKFSNKPYVSEPQGYEPKPYDISSHQQQSYPGYTDKRGDTSKMQESYNRNRLQGKTPSVSGDFHEPDEGASRLYSPNTPRGNREESQDPYYQEFKSDLPDKTWEKNLYTPNSPEQDTAGMFGYKPELNQSKSEYPVGQADDPYGYQKREKNDQPLKNIPNHVQMQQPYPQVYPQPSIPSQVRGNPQSQYLNSNQPHTSDECGSKCKSKSSALPQTLNFSDFPAYEDSGNKPDTSQTQQKSHSKPHYSRPQENHTENKRPEFSLSDCGSECQPRQEPPPTEHSTPLENSPEPDPQFQDYREDEMEDKIIESNQDYKNHQSAPRKSQARPHLPHRLERRGSGNGIAGCHFQCTSNSDQKHHNAIRPTKVLRRQQNHAYDQTNNHNDNGSEEPNGTIHNIHFNADEHNPQKQNAPSNYERIPEKNWIEFEIEQPVSQKQGPQERIEKSPHLVGCRSHCQTNLTKSENDPHDQPKGSNYGQLPQKRPNLNATYKQRRPSIQSQQTQPGSPSCGPKCSPPSNYSLMSRQSASPDPNSSLDDLELPFSNGNQREAFYQQKYPGESQSRARNNQSNQHGRKNHLKSDTPESEANPKAENISNGNPEQSDEQLIRNESDRNGDNYLKGNRAGSIKRNQPNHQPKQTQNHSNPQRGWAKPEDKPLEDEENQTENIESGNSGLKDSENNERNEPKQLSSKGPNSQQLKLKDSRPRNQSNETNYSNPIQSNEGDATPEEASKNEQNPTIGNEPNDQKYLSPSKQQRRHPIQRPFKQQQSAKDSTPNSYKNGWNPMNENGPNGNSEYLLGKNSQKEEADENSSITKNTAEEKHQGRNKPDRGKSKAGGRSSYNSNDGGRPNEPVNSENNPESKSEDSPKEPQINNEDFSGDKEECRSTKRCNPKSEDHKPKGQRRRPSKHRRNHYRRSHKHNRRVQQMFLERQSHRELGKSDNETSVKTQNKPSCNHPQQNRQQPDDQPNNNSKCSLQTQCGSPQNSSKSLNQNPGSDLNLKPRKEMNESNNKKPKEKPPPEEDSDESEEGDSSEENEDKADLGKNDQGGMDQGNEDYDYEEIKGQRKIENRSEKLNPEGKDTLHTPLQKGRQPTDQESPAHNKFLTNHDDSNESPAEFRNSNWHNRANSNANRRGY